MKNILYIIDDKVNIEKFAAFVKRRWKANDLKFFICPITIDNDLSHRAKECLSAYGDVKILPFINEFHKNAFSYKNSFIKTLSDFSTGNGKDLISLREYFTHPLEKFSLWWLSSIEEKSPLKNQSYHNFAKLMTVIGFQRHYLIDEVYIDIKNNVLKRSIIENRSNEKIYTKNSLTDNIIIELIVSFSIYC